MTFDTIRKTDSARRARANLHDLDAAREAFSWDDVRAELEGLPDGGLNIAHEAIDRHVAAGRGDKVAIRWLSKEGAARDITYGELKTLTNRFAGALCGLGLEKGDVVFGLLGRVPEQYVAALGALKGGFVYSPLFSAFGPEPVRSRIELGSGKALVTADRLYERKVRSWRNEVRHLQHVICVGDGDPPQGEGVHRFSAVMKKTAEDFETVATSPDDMALLHFTSGTTGRPKGAVHVHEAVLHHYMSGKYALDIHEDDVFWCTADPGWVTGTSYGIIAPLVIGATMIVDEQEFEADRWYRTLQDHRVTVWYTAPTAIRMLMRAGDELARKYDLSNVRFMSSVGEPLNPEAVVWSNRVFDTPFHDNWWQTETGGIMIANFASEDVKPGSMGRPLPGIEAAIVNAGEDGSVEAVTDPMREGELALKSGWPSMFRAYLNQEDRYRKSFAGGWYLTGDLAKQDEEGYFWFVGRADDVIKAAGHLVGPFEVESALIEHEAVAEAGVIGIPDEVAGNVIKAFVTLHAGHEPSEELRKALLGHARKRLGPAVAPKQIEFRESLPKTRSGKIMRRLLKARELGLPEGDLSTLETDEK